LRHRLELIPEARLDIHALRVELGKEVLRLLVTLERDPYLGRQMWLVKGHEVLTDWRSIKVAIADHDNHSLRRDRVVHTTAGAPRIRQKTPESSFPTRLA
jgi:hypothetical protein